MGSFIDIAGERYGKLVALYRIKASSPTKWKFQCDCGKRVTAMLHNVRSGLSRSCGCSRTPAISSPSLRRVRLKTYNLWYVILQKPHNPRWDDFELFALDMGMKPKGKYLCRKHLDKPYSRANCYWGDRQQLFRNKLWVVNGESFTSLRSAAEKHGKSDQTIKNWCCGYYNRGFFYPPREDCFVENVK